MVKAVLLDGDGVLLDSVGYCVTYYPQVAKAMGFEEKDKTEILSFWGIHWEDFLRALWPGIDSGEFDRVCAEMGFDDKIIPQIKWAEETVFRLRQGGYFLALISNRDRESLNRRFKQAGIYLQNFILVQAFEDCPFHKPDPRVFEPALALAAEQDIRREEAIYVGDTITDFESAKAAGLAFVGMTTGGMSKEGFLAAGLPEDRILDSIVALPIWLERTGRDKGIRVKVSECPECGAGVVKTTIGNIRPRI